MINENDYTAISMPGKKKKRLARVIHVEEYVDDGFKQAVVQDVFSKKYFIIPVASCEPLPSKEDLLSAPFTYPRVTLGNLYD